MEIDKHFGFERIVHPEIKQISHYFVFILFKTCMTFFCGIQKMDREISHKNVI